MKEHIARTKMCCGPCATNFVYCKGSECMGWEPEYREENKTIDATADIPEGWHKISFSAIDGIQIRRYIRTNEGDCGLKSKEPGCFYPG